MSKRRLLDLLFVLISACFTPAAAQQQKFDGVWEAKFKGDVFMTVKVHVADTVSGTMNGGHLEVNNDGDITEASGGGKELAISNAKIEDNKLSFDCVNDDETMKLVMKITGDGEAELQFLNLPEGVKMRPIRFRKA